MKTRLTFWTIYVFVILFIYLGSNFDILKKSEVGIQQSTIYLLKQLEGVRHTAYDDGYGNMTIGVGHLIKSDEPHLYFATLSKNEVLALLERDMEPCSNAIKTRVNLPLSQSQFDALMSFCHNIGPDKFVNSSVVRLINHGEYQKAADAMFNWNKPNSVMKRRKQERKLFLQGA